MRGERASGGMAASENRVSRVSCFSDDPINSQLYFVSVEQNPVNVRDRNNASEEVLS
jgi:hypothetical protein